MRFLRATCTILHGLFGVYQTAIDPLHFIRSDTPTDVIHTVHKPGLCIVEQGRKQVQLWEECYTYYPLNYLVVSVTLPLAGQVTEASSERPYCFHCRIQSGL